MIRFLEAFGVALPIIGWVGARYGVPWLRGDGGTVARPRTHTAPTTALKRGDRILWTRDRVLTVEDRPHPAVDIYVGLVVPTVELGDIVITEDEVEVVVG